MSAKKIALAMTATVGAILFLFPLVTGMLGKTQGVDNLTGSLRSNFEPNALAQTRTDMNTVQTMSDQLQAKTLPALPAALGMSPEQFHDFMGTNFPDVASGVSQLNTILPKFQGLVAGMEDQSANFRSADQIPTNFLPSMTVPFLFLVPGAALFLLAGGALILDRDGKRKGMTRAGLAVGVLVGIVFVVAPLALSVPAKTKAVDNLTTAFGPVFTDNGAAAVRSDMDVIQKMSDQLQDQTLPALAGALKMDPAQFKTFVGQNFPAVANGVSQLNTILPRFQELVSAIGQNVGNFQQAAAIPTAGQSTTSLAWWFFIPGGILVLVGGFGMAVPRRREVATQVLPGERTLVNS